MADWDPGEGAMDREESWGTPLGVPASWGTAWEEEEEPAPSDGCCLCPDSHRAMGSTLGWVLLACHVCRLFSPDSCRFKLLRKLGWMRGKDQPRVTQQSRVPDPHGSDTPRSWHPSLLSINQPWTSFTASGRAREESLFLSGVSASPEPGLGG